MQKDLRESQLYISKKGEKGSWVTFLLVLALLLSIFFSVRNYWVTSFSGVIVSGHSMDDTLFDGEKLLMKLTSSGEKAERGDIIVVDVRGYKGSDKLQPNENFGDTKFLIKRLIAVEGDVVRCKDGELSIQYGGTGEFKKLKEPYAKYIDKLGYDFKEDYVVGKDEIFFLGDNRDNSIDSRYNETDGSHLTCLYMESDIYGIVPEWAIEHREVLEKIFFRN
ncbi:MAG: signal peptidase I [Clostridia bacterium]|nr:signal peptidase I [Clostridia bacterium]